VGKLRSIQLISVFDAKRAVMILGRQKHHDASSLIFDVSEEQEYILKQYNIDFIDSNDPANYCF
jgi:hypothetical protein